MCTVAHGNVSCCLLFVLMIPMFMACIAEVGATSKGGGVRMATAGKGWGVSLLFDAIKCYWARACMLCVTLTDLHWISVVALLRAREGPCVRDL